MSRPEPSSSPPEPVTEPLDNPVWHALTGPHATLAEGSGSALRYRADVSVFAAMPDDVTPVAWDDLETLVGPGGGAVLFRAEPAEPPGGWTVRGAMPTRQMVAAKPLPAELDGVAIGTPLGPADVADALELVARTRPGPFLARTIETGRYVGVREHGALVAMAGERMRMPGATEISAVCVAPEHRSRGLAAALVATVTREIRAQGRLPFLHVLVENTGAVALYEKLGFETRVVFEVTLLQAPGGAPRPPRPVH